MSLRQLLIYAHENPEVRELADAASKRGNGGGERAFVSASLRPYLLSALLDMSPDKPALVVAGDDRAARDLAADLKTFLGPRTVRFYPARGVRYESHLAPPPHLVGLRVAALDALASGPAVVVASAARAGGEGARPRAPPARLQHREGRHARPRGDRRPARRVRLRAHRPGRGSRPVRDPRRHPRRLPSHRGARRPLRAVRHRGRAAHVLLHLHAALARGGGPDRDRPRRRDRARAPRAGGDGRAGGGGPAPGCGRGAPGRPLLRPDVARPRRRARGDRRGGGGRAVAGRLLGGGHDQLPRRGRAQPLHLSRHAARAARRMRLDPPVEHLPGPAARVPRPGRRHRRAVAARGRA